MNDRLGDIGLWAGDGDDSDHRSESFENEGARGDVEMQECAKQPKHMEHFFREVETIKDDIECVKTATRQIGEFNEAAIQATSSDEENDISRQIRPLIDNTNKRAKRSKTLLGLLKEESQKLQSNGKINPSDLRYVPKYNSQSMGCHWRQILWISGIRTNHSVTHLLGTFARHQNHLASGRICATH